MANQDLKYGIRTLARNPGFAAIAVLTLALGVGANTAIFSVVKAVLLNQLPYRDADRLVAIAESDRDTKQPVTVDFTTTYDLRARNRSFDNLVLYRDWTAAMAEQGDPELMHGLRVNWDYFDALGVAMQLGRSFQPADDRPEAAKVMILSHGLWLRRFGGDPQVIGRTVHLNEATFTVVGVLPRNFQPIALSQSDPVREMYSPLGYALGGPSSCRGCQHLRLLGRLKPGVAASTGTAELKALMHDIVREHPADYSATTTAILTPLRTQIVGKVQTALYVLLGAVGLVLLIACANITNLLLARSSGRAKEIALRAALGAGRDRLIRQLLTENLVLAICGGGLGVMLAMWGTSLLSYLAPREVPRVAEVHMDIPVLLFGLGASLLSGILFSIAPALRSSRVDLSVALKDASKSTTGRAGVGIRNSLAAAELALAFVLVVGAGLLGNSFLRLMNVDAGYNPHNVLTVNTYVYGKQYQKSPEAELAYYKRAISALLATGGIESVGMVSTLPLTSFDRTGFHIEDRPVANPSDAPSVDRYSASPGYFQAMRIPLKRGRPFDDQDRIGAPKVALISESCARSLFEGRDPIGKHIQLGGRDEKKPWITVVGVVGDVRQYGLDQAPSMAAYIPQAQDLNYGYTLVARTTIDPRNLESAVRSAFLSADKTQPVYDIKPMEDYLQSSLAERTFTLLLLGLFGLLALVLAAVGIYGVISYAVSLRTRELGIRMALGASRNEVLAMVLRQGATLTGAGLIAGLAASLVLTRFLSSLLYGVRSGDVTTSALVALVMIGVALVASYIPARRATQVDPMVALRWE